MHGTTTCAGKTACSELPVLRNTIKIILKTTFFRSFLPRIPNNCSKSWVRREHLIRDSPTFFVINIKNKDAFSISKTTSRSLLLWKLDSLAIVNWDSFLWFLFYITSSANSKRQWRPPQWCIQIENTRLVGFRCRMHFKPHTNHRTISEWMEQWNSRKEVHNMVLCKCVRLCHTENKNENNKFSLYCHSFDRLLFSLLFQCLVRCFLFTSFDCFCHTYCLSACSVQSPFVFAFFHYSLLMVLRNTIKMRWSGTLVCMWWSVLLGCCWHCTRYSQYESILN